MNIAGHCSICFERDGFSIEAEFDIPARGILGVFGQSGSGKTTMLRCIAGLEKNVRGRISFNGQHWLDDNDHVSVQARNVGVIFQDGRLFPHLSVLDNLHYGEERNRNPGDSSIDKKHLFELLHLEHLLDRKPQQLSGGEQQRVAIGRALMKNPQLLLMDEPLASLDENRKQEILPFLDCLHAELSIPMLYVSHSLDEVSRFCDHMLVMQQGRIVYQGSIHDTLVSAESPLSKAENAAALLEGTVTKQDGDIHLSSVQTASGNRLLIQGMVPPGKQVRMRVQARDISLAKTRANDTSILNILPGKISQVIEQGEAHVLVQIDCKGDVLLTRITRKSWRDLGLEPGLDVFAQIKAVSIRGF